MSSSVTVKISEHIYAVGDPVDMGIYTAAYIQAIVTSSDYIKQRHAEMELAEKLAKDIKGVKVVPMRNTEDKDAEKR